MTTTQTMTIPAPASPEIMAARRISIERIHNYKTAENPARQRGAITKEVGRVASIDPEFALEIAYGLDPSMQANALAIVGAKAGDLGALSDAKDIALSSGFSPSEQSDKLSIVAELAVSVDPLFAYETATEIPMANKRADALIRIAGKAKFKYMQPLGGQRYHHSEVMEPREGIEENNFSVDLLRQMVKEADRTINDNSLWGERRNMELADVCAALDLTTTYNALLRGGSSVSGALFVIGRYVKGYIDERLFSELEKADPSGELTISAFKQRIENINDPDNEDERLARRLSLGGILDPVLDASELLRDIEGMAEARFQNPKPQFYRELLNIIRDGAAAKQARFDREEELKEEAERLAPAVDSWDD